MKINKISFAKVWTIVILLAVAYGFLGYAKSILARDDQIAQFKQQLIKSMKDVVMIAIGLADYITDNGIAPTQDGTYKVGNGFYNKLSPFYVKKLPVKDPWGGTYLVYCGLAANGKYGIKNCQEDDFVVVCLGRDGKKDSWEWNESNPEGGIFELWSLADFDKDLVMWNGSWVRAPASK